MPTSDKKNFWTRRQKTNKGKFDSLKLNPVLESTYLLGSQIGGL